MEKKMQSLNKKILFVSIRVPNPMPNHIESNTIEDNIIKDIRNLFKLEKNNAIKDKIITDIRTLFESEKEDYYEPVRSGNAFSNSSIKYESNSDKNKMLSIEEYCDKI